MFKRGVDIVTSSQIFGIIYGSFLNLVITVELSSVSVSLMRLGRGNISFIYLLFFCHSIILGHSGECKINPVPLLDRVI